MMRKKLIVAGIITCMALSISACGKNKETSSPKVTEVSTPEATKEPTPEPTPEPTVEPTTEATPEPTKEPTPKPTKEATPEATNDDKAKTEGVIDDDWTKMQFQFDGSNYEIPFSYQTLADAGWTFNLEDYGYSDGYILNPGDKVSGTIYLTNPAYKDSKISVQVGFINNGEKPQDILKCNIWDFMLDTCYGFEQQEKYPDMKIAKGITIGSTREEVDAAFGKCDDIYEAKEDGYVTYTYGVDYSKYLKFTIYDKIGVTSIELSSY